MSVIAKLHLDYWCDSKEERNKIYTILQNNEKKLNERLLKNIFRSS